MLTTSFYNEISEIVYNEFGKKSDYMKTQSTFYEQLQI